MRELEEALARIRHYQESDDPIEGSFLPEDAEYVAERIEIAMEKHRATVEALRDVRGSLRTAEIGIKGAIEWSTAIIDATAPARRPDLVERMADDFKRAGIAAQAARRAFAKDSGG